MFDNLVAPKRKYPAKKIPPHHHGIVFLLVVGVVTSVVGLNFNLSSRKVSVVTHAAGPAVTLRLIDDGIADYAVAPLRQWPIATIQAVIRQPVSPRMIRFLLDGVYNPSAVEGITLYLNNVQVGYPAYPDQDGAVTFDFDTLSLSPGTYLFRFALTTVPGGTISAFRAVFDPIGSFSFTDPTLSISSLTVPVTTSLVSVGEHGTLSSFIRREGSAPRAADAWASVYLNIDGEDAMLKGIHLTADRDLTGSRVDFFEGDTFLVTALFNGAEAEADFEKTSIKILRQKSTKLTALVDLAQSADIPRLLLDRISARTFQSNTTIDSTPGLVLLP